MAWEGAKPPTIIIVDDEVEVVNVMRRILSRQLPAALIHPDPCAILAPDKHKTALCLVSSEGGLLCIFDYAQPRCYCRSSPMHRQTIKEADGNTWHNSGRR